MSRRLATAGSDPSVPEPIVGDDKLFSMHVRMHVRDEDSKDSVSTGLRNLPLSAEGMALIALAESAQDIASGFNKFLDPLPEISTEITALISECYAISSALRELNNAKEEPRYYQEYEIIYNDVAVVRETLDYTFRDVTRFFGGLGRPTHISRRTAFHQVWREIDDFFYQESTASLCKRLEASRLFLTELICVLMDG
ncbi:MAG: hypothetical protein Q9215_006678 [Flavoplaca cf. flavocitrina]